MSWIASLAALGLPHRLALIIEGLCGVITACCGKDREAVPVLFLAWTRLRRLAARFEALVAELRAGRVPAAPSPSGRDEALPQLPGLPACPQPYRLPCGFGWLLRLVPESAAFAGQVEHLLADPEMAALLAGSPQAGLLLQPLCRMLGIRPGPELASPPRRRPASRADAGEVDLAAASGGRSSRPQAARVIPPGAPPRAGAGILARYSPGAGTTAPDARHEGADPPLNVPWRAAPG
ncbi:MAG: hypothetical protein JOY71_08900 [Acetobacteraceae bacterium]|nr:hypothetical protein [Acetobacteraceae bacterium]